MILELIQFLRRVIEPRRAPDVSAPDATPAPNSLRTPSLREEYEAMPRGPGGVRRKRNSLVQLAARHKMSVNELRAAVRRSQ